MNGKRTVIIMTLCLLGCGSEDVIEPPAPLMVQWIDKNGATWFAPPVTPEAGDPLFEGHPEPKVVLIDRATRKKVLVANPREFLQTQQENGAAHRWIFMQQSQ